MDPLSEAAYHASGCRSLTDFLSSPACHGVQYAYLGGDDVDWGSRSRAEDETPSLGSLHISVKKLRAREEQGSLPGFLRSLPLLPSCTELCLLHVELASLDELAGLCEGIASPLCTLRTLDLSGLKVSSAESGGADDATKCLVKDALVGNTSLEKLFITSPFLCTPEEHWIPCSLKHLLVDIEGGDTLDVMLGVLTALSHNHISLSTLSITCKNDLLHGINLQTDYLRSQTLHSEKQLGAMLLTNTSLTELHLYNLVMPIHAFSSLFAALNENRNVRSFTLCGYPFLPGEVVRRLFAALEENCSLTFLDISRNWGEDWPSASLLLDTLRVNSTLVDVEWLETPFEDEVELEAWEEMDALAERNRKNVEERNARMMLHLK